MARGLPRAIIKKYGITKKAWSVYRGRKSSTRKTKKSRAKGSKRRVKKTAKKKRRRRSFSTATMFKFVRLAALGGPAVYAATSAPKGEKVRVGLEYYTGFNVKTGKFYAKALWTGYGPYLVTTLIHRGISKASGIIRSL